MRCLVLVLVSVGITDGLFVVLFFFSVLRELNPRPIGMLGEPFLWVTSPAAKCVSAL